MKRIFTLLTLLVSVLSGFSQAGTTYRWKPATTSINGANFLLATNWNIVSTVDGSLSASGVNPTTGAVLQVLSNLTVTTNDIDLRTAGAFTITIGGGYSANTTLNLGGNDLRLAFGSTVNLQSRLAGGVGACRTATITLGNGSEIRIYNAALTDHVKKAENTGANQSFTANCTSGTSTYVAAGYNNPAYAGSTGPKNDANEGFQGFLAQAGGPTLLLPLQLKEFSAQKGSGKVTLNWSTVLEINTSHFEVEQSNNGVSWKSIAVVPAKGNSNSVQKYSADDIAFYSSKVYYRLKMVDLDGKFEYSPISVVTFGGKGKMFAYPNPAASFTMISSDNAISENVTVSIYNTTGVLVKQQMISNPGNNFRVGLEDLKQGTYLLKINQGAELLEVIKIQKN
jgi:hypothetical protein